MIYLDSIEIKYKLIITSEPWSQYDNNDVCKVAHYNACISKLNIYNYVYYIIILIDYYYVIS